jgi:pimeloyl-ACP methyl ester carboxylesterase
MYARLTTDRRGDLATIHIPLTILYAHDAPMRPDAMISGLHTNAYAAHPNHPMVRVDQSFHFVPLDQPEAFAAAVAEFLR